MIVRQFLEWARTAPEDARAKAVAALAKVYLRPDLAADDRAEMDAALPQIAGDPSPLVQLALASALCRHPLVPADLVLRLAALGGAAGEEMLTHSPVLNMRELIGFAATDVVSRQVAIADREALPAPVSAALAESGDVAACLALVRNPTADVPGFALGHIVSRFGHVPELRAALLVRHDLPPAAHHALIRAVAGTLSSFVGERQWLPPAEAARVAREACESAAVNEASRRQADEVRALVEALHGRGELTSALVLRSLLCGQVRLFLEAVSVISGIKIDHVAALAADRSGEAFRLLYDRIGLPAGAFIGFRTALEVVQAEAYLDEEDEAPGLKQRIVERVIAAYEAEGETAGGNGVVALLRRWRDEAKDTGRVIAA